MPTHSVAASPHTMAVTVHRTSLQLNTAQCCISPSIRAGDSAMRGVVMIKMN